MKRRVEFTVDVPDNCSEEDLREWLRFRLGENGEMMGSNLLVDRELEAQGVTVIKRNG